MPRRKGKRTQGTGRKPEELEVAGAQADAGQREHESGAQASPRPRRVPGAWILA